MRQVELADDDLDVHAEVVFVAENLDHAAARILGRRGPVGDLHIHHQAFEIVPLAAARLFAEDAIVVGRLLARGLLCLSPRHGNRGHRPMRSGRSGMHAPGAWAFVHRRAIPSRAE